MQIHDFAKHANSSPHPSVFMEAGNMLTNALHRLFPSYIIRVIPNTNISDNMRVTFVNVSDIKNAPNGIADNASGFHKIVCLAPSKRDDKYTAEMVVTGVGFRKAGIKLRKTSADSPEALATKLIAWYTKNAGAILALDS